MGIECAVISGLFLIFIAVFICTKRRQWAWATLPLLLVPLTDFMIEYMLKKAFSDTYEAFFRRKSDVFKELSMGMSGDYKIAAACGATIIRPGTAIFGARSYQQL